MIVILKACPPGRRAAANAAEALSNAIDAWIIATDVDNAKEQAVAKGEFALAGKLHRIADQPPGRYLLLGDYVVLTN